MDKSRMLELAGVLNEAAEYSDSVEFTHDYETVLSHVQQIYKIINTKKWDNWMKVTERNFSVKTTDTSDAIKRHVKGLKKECDALEDEFDKADQG